MIVPRKKPKLIQINLRKIPTTVIVVCACMCVYGMNVVIGIFALIDRKKF